MKNIHYKLFTMTKVINDEKSKVKKTLFLTHKGLVRCPYVSRNKNAYKFQDWACPPKVAA